jgi:hypothetical protein
MLNERIFVLINSLSKAYAILQPVLERLNPDFGMLCCHCRLSDKYQWVFFYGGGDFVRG